MEQTPAYRTAVTEEALVPDDAGDSAIVSRSDRRFFRHMPPLATERVDEAGVSLLREWITALAPRGID